MPLMRPKKFLLALVALALLVFVGRPVLFLTRVWLKDGAKPLAFAPAGLDDASRMNPNQPREVIPVAGDAASAEKQLAALVARAAKEHLRG